MAGEGKPPGWLDRAMGDTPRFLRTRVWIAALAYAGGMLLTMAPDVYFGGVWPAQVSVGLLAAIAAAVCFFLIRSFRRVRARLAAAGGLLCWRCGFDLTGTPSPGRCPECGDQFEVASTRARWARTDWGWRTPTKR